MQSQICVHSKRVPVLLLKTKTAAQRYKLVGVARREIRCNAQGDSTETSQPDDSKTVTQTYSSGEFSVEMPLTGFQQWPIPAQGAGFLGVMAAIGGATYVTCSTLAPGVEALVPGLLQASRSAWPLLGGIYALLGVTHFASTDQYCTMMPKRGAWGIWYLPGAPSLHVYWTGAAEVLGGVGLLAGSRPDIREAVGWLEPASALGLFVLTLAITPANIYMATHNAPGPGPPGAVTPVSGHISRGVFQVIFLSTLWGLAHPPPI
eukprot:CAMPEP_0198228274 /NCGR_PEP_ID=MMETSP1445-20131203/112613_1 /TAXON_ID=36898 /ORGANISM="Pyramimonas sp., Strain CCMP2087" /LENGTH=261 /DNA_ID=CAMNT_0043908591 /DNA_START=75 /DNA_END=860 /DNA_ORIENTATION=-